MERKRAYAAAAQAKKEQETTGPPQASKRLAEALPRPDGAVCIY